MEKEEEEKGEKEIGSEALAEMEKLAGTPCRRESNRGPSKRG